MSVLGNIVIAILCDWECTAESACITKPQALGVDSWCVCVAEGTGILVPGVFMLLADDRAKLEQQRALASG